MGLGHEQITQRLGWDPLLIKNSHVHQAGIPQPFSPTVWNPDADAPQKAAMLNQFHGVIASARDASGSAVSLNPAQWDGTAYIQDKNYPSKDIQSDGRTSRIVMRVRRSQV